MRIFRDGNNTYIRIWFKWYLVQGALLLPVDKLKKDLD